MVNSGNVLLRRPPKNKAVSAATTATTVSVGIGNDSKDGNSSGEEGPNTPSAPPPTNFVNIGKVLQQLSVKEAASEISSDASSTKQDDNISAGLLVLDKLARRFILNALFIDMGWSPKLGETFTVDSLVAEFKLDRNNQYLIGTLLTRLEEPLKKGVVPILTRLPFVAGDDLLDFEWKVTGVIPNTSRIRQSLKELQTELVLDYPSLNPELNFLNHAGPKLYACIRGRMNARDVLWPSKESPEYRHGLLSYYERSLRVQEGPIAYLKEAVGQFVLALAADPINSIQDTIQNVVTGGEPKGLEAAARESAETSAPPALLRILEIGATGSCSATIPVVRHMISVCNNNSASLPTEALNRIVYTFSDSSNIALGKAKAILEGQFPDFKFEFKVLDLEAEPPSDEQEQQQGEYDIVLGLNAVHLAKYLDDNLRHIRKLLKSGGLLVLGELFGLTPFLECTLGLSDAWWRYADRIRSSQGPLLNGKQWESALQQYGFAYAHSLTCFADDGNNDAPFGIVLATDNNTN